MFRLPPVFPMPVPEHRQFRSWIDPRLGKLQLNTQSVSQMREAANLLGLTCSHLELLQVVKISMCAGLGEKRSSLINWADLAATMEQSTVITQICSFGSLLSCSYKAPMVVNTPLPFLTPYGNI